MFVTLRWLKLQAEAVHRDQGECFLVQSPRTWWQGGARVPLCGTLASEQADGNLSTSGNTIDADKFSAMLRKYLLWSQFRHLSAFFPFAKINSKTLILLFVQPLHMFNTWRICCFSLRMQSWAARASRALKILYIYGSDSLNEHNSEVQNFKSHYFFSYFSSVILLQLLFIQIPS